MGSIRGTRMPWCGQLWEEKRFCLKEKGELEDSLENLGRMGCGQERSQQKGEVMPGGPSWSFSLFKYYY